MNQSQRQNLIEIEAHWNERMCELVSDDRLDDSDAIYLEYVVDGEEPDGWVFLEYLNGVC